MKNNNSTLYKKPGRGFTLIELLVVVLIIGIFSAISLPGYLTALEKTRFSEVFINLKAINTVAEMYFLEHGAWPDNFGDLSISFGKKCTGTNCTVGKFTYTFANIAQQRFSVYMSKNVGPSALALTLLLADDASLGNKKGDISCFYRNKSKYQKLCLALNGKTQGNKPAGGAFYILGR